MILIAVANGTARDLGYKNMLGELTARQVSTLSLMILFGIYIFYVIQRYPPQSPMQAIWIGLLWLLLTLIFEFGMGLATGISWKIMLEEFNILKGRLWILTPIWVTVAPYIAFRFLNCKQCY